MGTTERNGREQVQPHGHEVEHVEAPEIRAVLQAAAEHDAQKVGTEGPVDLGHVAERAREDE